MKKLLFTLLILFNTLASPLFSQNFVELNNGEDQEINGILVSYNAVLKESKKGSDLYRITTTITNQGADYLRFFDSSPETFVEKPENAIAYFQFTNANGKALSATKEYFYPIPRYIKVSYKCKKCPPPTNKDEDPYEHYTKSVIIGTHFVSGSTSTKVSSVRVNEGEIPEVRVMVYYKLLTFHTRF